MACGPCGKTACSIHCRSYSMVLSVSKYCVIRSKSMTSFGVDPSTLLEKSETVICKPFTIAERCLATPAPSRYFASASASAL